MLRDSDAKALVEQTKQAEQADQTDIVDSEYKNCGKDNSGCLTIFVSIFAFFTFVAISPFNTNNWSCEAVISPLVSLLMVLCVLFVAKVKNRADWYDLFCPPVIITCTILMILNFFGVSIIIDDHGESLFNPKFRTFTSLFLFFNIILILKLVPISRRTLLKIDRFLGSVLTPDDTKIADTRFLYFTIIMRGFAFSMFQVAAIIVLKDYMNAIPPWIFYSLVSTLPFQCFHFIGFIARRWFGVKDASNRSFAATFASFWLLASILLVVPAILNKLLR